MTTTARLLVLVPVLLAGLLLAPSSSWADPRAEARTKLVQGGELLKHGQFDEALQRFQEAYKLVPSPKIQYNFGLAYRGMGRKADALEAFERFLAEAPDASKETRQTAERERAQLLGQVTVLEVKVDLEGAEIFVDGRSYGTTHSSGIYLNPGPHQLSVEKAGEGPAYTERINALAGQRITVMARLARTPSAAPPSPRDSSPPRVEPLPPPGGRDVPPPPAATAPRWQPIVAWAAAGGAVVAAGFGTYELMSSNSKYDDFNHRAECGEVKQNRGGPACSTLFDDATSARQKAYVGFAVAGVFAATSVVFFLLTPERSGGSVALACAPSLLNPGLSCAARF
jgi:tetratricopeptide (TPR) repeat protein